MQYPLDLDTNLYQPLKSTNSVSGFDLLVNPLSNSIGSVKEREILSNKFTYSSDKTLRPKANVSPTIILENLNTIDQILVTNGGEGYATAPTLKLVDSVNRNVIDSGILKPILTGSAISSIIVESEPKGFAR